jgi:hypothetical protein
MFSIGICHIPPLPSERGRGEGRVKTWRALAAPMLPDAKVKTALDYMHRHGLRRRYASKVCWRALSNRLLSF